MARTRQRLKGEKMQRLQEYLQSHTQLSESERNAALDKFGLFYDLLLQWNSKFNLTAITAPEDVEIKHFIDSLSGYSQLASCRNICDIGAGAGFPGLMLAIIMPDAKFTLVDSLSKRVKFLNEAISTLQLTNCVALHNRAEDFAAQYRESFDACVARAVASLPTLSEYCLPLLKIGGLFLAYKGSNWQEEVAQSGRAIALMGGILLDPKLFTLPNGDFRALICVEKRSSTPKNFPRGGNKPKSDPIL